MKVLTETQTISSHRYCTYLYGRRCPLSIYLVSIYLIYHKRPLRTVKWSILANFFVQGINTSRNNIKSKSFSNQKFGPDLETNSTKLFWVE